MNVNDVDSDKTKLGEDDIIKFDEGNDLVIETKAPKYYYLLARVTKNTFIDRARVYWVDGSSPDI